MSKTDNEYFEIPLLTLICISKDIVLRAARAGFSEDYLKECVVRLPKDQDEKNPHYDLGFPEYPF